MIYNNFIESKTSQLIPLFNSGKSFHSKYNPEKEAQNFISTVEKKDFYLLTGLGAGFYLSELRNNFPDSYILVLEASQEDLNFLFTSLPCLKKFEDNKTSFCTLDNIISELVLKYIPAIYSTFEVVCINSWIQEINKEEFQKKISEALELISKDFSTQAHFGKIWQKNIILNLKKADFDSNFKLPVNKECLVVAAGPSLDQKINFIKENKDHFFILATDTAYKSLYNAKIKADAVISIDGQSVSYRHFSQKINKDTIYIFDLMGNASAISKIKRKTKNIIFTTSNHPFEMLAENFSDNSFFKIDSSSGTVTIAAIDFAIKCGFSKITLLGADFGYLNNKAYTKGTYLDSIYYVNKNKTISAEKLYSGLMFRTDLIKLSDKKVTTEILSFYEKNLFDWCEKNQIQIEKGENVYKIQKRSSINNEIELKKFNANKFFKLLPELLSDDKLCLPLLPLISWMKNQDSKKGITRNFNEYKNIAMNFIERYNF